MKKIGIVGGVAWLSTVDYYTEICRRSERWHRAQNRPGLPSTPEMTIESLDHRKAVSFLGMDGDEESWLRFDEYHRSALQRLEASGAEFALIASNTAHHRFASIVRGIGIPVISILDVTAAECARLGATDVLLLGTDITMKSNVFRQEFAKHGVRAAGPDDEEARAQTIELIAELSLDQIDGAAERLCRIAKPHPVVCLACTELSLAFPERKTLSTFNYAGTLYLNTTALHIDAAFRLSVADEPVT